MWLVFNYYIVDDMTTLYMYTYSKFVDEKCIPSPDSFEVGASFLEWLVECCQSVL